MSKRTFITLIAVFSILSGFSNAQTFEGWNIYTSFKEVTGVGLSNNMVWAATTGGLFSFDINSPANTINKYTTLQGLLSNELTTVLVDNSGNVWSGASDGSISVYYPSSSYWRVMADILNSTEPNKNINGLFQYGNYLFISTEFSLIKFDIMRFEIVDQPYTNLGPLLPVKTPVYNTLVVNDTVWAATKNGIAYANINSNLPIPTSWLNYTASNSVMLKNKTNTIAYFDNKVFFGTDSGMVYHSGNGLSLYQPLYNGNPITDKISHMAVRNGNLYFSTSLTSNNIFKVTSNNINQAALVYSGDVIGALNAAPGGELLIGTANKGVNIFKNGTSNYILPNSPYSNIFFNMAVDGNSNLWAVSGSLGDWAPYSGVYRFDGSSWKNYLYQDYPVMGNGCCGWKAVYPSAYSGDVWVSGLGNGLLKINGDNITLYTDTNSCLKSTGGPGFVVVIGMDEDYNRNLWVLNLLTQYPILNFTTCQSFPLPAGNSTITSVVSLAIDKYNTLWMTLGNEGGSLKGIEYFNPSVPTGGVVTTDQLGADIRAANDIIVDNNGEVWVATDNGISIIADPYQVIANPNSLPSTQKMRIIENGISTPLTENVNTLRCDALNNKWLGTNSSGVLYVSQDGSTLINQFTMKNSPLPDNKINCLAADPRTGIVYIGTQNGMVSYKTVAVQPLTDFDKITAGPNPFLIPNEHMLRIDGLVENSSVKILSISGTLVRELQTPGGRIANWDGRDDHGNLVSSGIYIIVGYNSDGSKAGTGKVAVVRR